MIRNESQFNIGYRVERMSKLADRRVSLGATLHDLAGGPTPLSDYKSEHWVKSTTALILDHRQHQ